MDTSNIIVLVYFIFVSLNHTNCKDDVLVKSCPEDKRSWDTAARRKECKPEDGRNFVYHCLKNEGKQLVETCQEARWIEFGVCPVLYNGDKFGFENCTLILLRTGGACPKTTYYSNELYRFPICFEILPKTTMTQLNTTTEIMTVSDTPAGGNSSRNITTERATVSVRDCKDCSGGIVGIVAGVIVPLLVIGIMIIVIYLKHKRRQDYNRGTDVENGQDSSLLNKESTGPSDVQQRQATTEEGMPLLSNKESTGTPEMGIVQLTAFTEGLHILKEYGILIITGQIGSGKTTAMGNIIQHLQEEDSEWKVKDISFLTPGRSYSYNDKLIIKWDDCFGKFVPNPVKKEKTMDMLTVISKWVTEGDGNRKCVLTMRENEFLSFNVYDSDLFRTNDEATHNKVCLDNLPEEEKVSLLEISKEISSCDECSDIHKTNITKELMDETESVKFSALGWPLICRLASIPYIAKDIIFFKNDPVRCVMSLFDTLESTNQQLYCAMIYVLFKGGNICRTDAAFFKEISEKLAQDGKSESTDDPMKFSRDELNNIFHTHPHYFVQKDKECYEFHHEIFVLWLLCHFYNSFPETTIEHFDLDILIELLRPNNYIYGVNENYIETLCSFFPKEKHDNQAKLVKGDGDKKPVQCEEDVEQRAGIKTISSDILQQTEEGKAENQSWKFTLEEKMFSCFIQRVEKEKEVPSLHVDTEQKYDMLEGHPLLEDITFRRIYKQEEALTSVQISK